MWLWGGERKNEGQCASTRSQSPSPHIRSPVEFEAAFIPNVEHQITPIEELHHKEEVVLQWGGE